jgi:anti-sigma regulatory factor (Ser/Thr protein kinase)
MNNDPLKLPIYIRISAHPDNLAVVRGAVRALASQANLSSHDIDKIILAISEALTNIIRHSYNGPCDDPIEIAMGQTIHQPSGRPALQWVIRDYGKTVDPATIKGRDLEDIRPGGLGIHIMQAVMDIVEFQKPDHPGMILLMVKFIDTSSPETPSAETVHPTTMKEGHLK